MDGVRRIEHRLLIGDGERTVFGLLGSFGVGAVLVDGRGPRRSTRRSAAWRWPAAA